MREMIKERCVCVCVYRYAQEGSRMNIIGPNGILSSLATKLYRPLSPSRFTLLSSSLLHRPLLEHACCTRRCPLITDISRRLIVGFQGER